MTIAQAIEQAQARKPGAVLRAVQVGWLSDLDRTVDAEILQTHAGAPPAFEGYAGDAPGDTALLVPEPYSQLYVYYLCAQGDALDQEFDLYANDAALYNRAFGDYRNRYNRTALPGQPAALHGRGEVWAGAAAKA